MASSPRIFSEGFLNSQKAKARTVFLTALGLLCLCASGTYFSFSYFKESEAWVAHTQEVRGVVGDLEAALNNAARARMAYLISEEQSALTEYQAGRSEEHTSELQSRGHLVCRLLLEKKKTKKKIVS